MGMQATTNERVYVPDKNQAPARPFRDPSLWLLIMANAIAAYFALKNGWNISVLMWIYWSQSVTIGLFNIVRMLQLKERVLHIPVFFAFHYGLFHFVYAMFMRDGTLFGPRSLGEGGLRYVLITIVAFFVNHGFSYFFHKAKETSELPAVMWMFYPYARIIPMHLMMIIGTQFQGAILLFLLLKTFADALMHIIEHTIFRRKWIRVS